jgi:hypothetical protein
MQTQLQQPIPGGASVQVALKTRFSDHLLIRQLQDELGCPSMGLLMRRALVRLAQSEPCVDPVLAVELEQALLRSEIRRQPRAAASITTTTAA